MEAERTDIEADLDRIEAAVAGGDHDLRKLGFWRAVARVKGDRALIAAHAERIGRIDTAAFRSGVRLRVPVWFGNMALGVAGLGGVAALAVAGQVDDPTVAGILIVGAGVVWTVALHCPLHWLVGSLVGIGFTDYFLGAKLPPSPGLKIDYATYLRTEPSKRAWMHASGAIGSKLAPFLALALAPRDATPGWAAAALAVLGVGQLVTDAVFSVRSSDWKRFLRERRYASRS